MFVRKFLSNKLKHKTLNLVSRGKILFHLAESPLFYFSLFGTALGRVDPENIKIKEMLQCPNASISESYRDIVD